MIKAIIALLILSVTLSFGKVTNEDLLKVITANKADSDKEFALAKQRLDQIDKKLEQVDKRLEQVDRRLDLVEQELSIMKVEQKNVQKNVETLRQDTNKRFDDLYNTLMMITTIISAILATLIAVVYNSSKQMNTQLRQFFEIAATKIQDLETKTNQLEQFTENPTSTQEQPSKQNFNDSIKLLIKILAQNDEKIAKQLKSAGLV